MSEYERMKADYDRVAEKQRAKTVAESPEMAAAQSRIRQLESALEFYSYSIWGLKAASVGGCTPPVMITEVIKDKGAVARKALKNPPSNERERPICQSITNSAEKAVIDAAKVLEVISSISPYDAADEAFNNNAEDGAKAMKDMIWDAVQALQEDKQS